jgi:hypothetical protein
MHLLGDTMPRALLCFPIQGDIPLYDPVVVDNGERDALEVLGRGLWAWSGKKL